tara:strand:+ start:84 stop:332 length:249 start_codon:yes stop_codon:yes gene_type:complete
LEEAVQKADLQAPMVHLEVFQVDLELHQLVVEEVVQNHLQETVYLGVQAVAVVLAVVLQEIQVQVTRLLSLQLKEQMVVLVL